MKVGDICSLDDAPNWYVWLKHKIEWREDSPMDMGTGCWILGVFNGPTVAGAFAAGEKAELVYQVPRKCKITRVGNLPVADADIEWPEFYLHTTDGRGNRVIYRCKGYDRIRKVKRMRKDVRFSFGFSPGGIAKAVNEGFFDRLVDRKRISKKRRKT